MGTRPRLTHLVPKLLANDQAALEQFVDGALRSLLALAVGSWKVPLEDAEEGALEAITATLTQLPKLVLDDQSGRDPLFGYLATAMRRAVLRQLRDRQREQKALSRLMNSESKGPMTILSAEGEPAGRIIWACDSATADGTRGEDVERLNAFLASLSDQDLLILELRAHTKLTWEEIAEELGTNSAHVRQRWHRIRERADRSWRNLEQESAVDVRREQRGQGQAR